jgi:DNA-binding NarL/FixJ family response regulator
VPWELDETRTSLRVVVADDASLIRSGIVQLLTASGFDVVAEAADADELTTAVDRDPPDLVITDIRMPPGHSDEGLRAAATIRSAHPEVAVLVLSQHIEARAAADLLDGRPAGIGYLLKERVSDLAEFVDACTAVADGGSVIDAMVAERLMRRRANDDVVARLTDRERDVLGAMARGLSNQAIADELYLGKKTIETHVGSIFQKLDLGESGEGNRRVQAVLQFLNARE